MKELIRTNKHLILLIIALPLIFIGMYTVTHIYKNEILPMIIFGIIAIAIYLDIDFLIFIIDLKRMIKQSQSQPKS